jgi:hypothetical protein
VIDEHFDDLQAVTSTSHACALLGASRATRYRRCRPPVAGPPAPRPTPPNALTDPERQHILTVLRSAEYCDLAPAQVWARLLDDGVYLCSISTMYRLLAIAWENRERRRQRTHPAKKKPELIARRPNEVWSWDITKLQGPTRGVYYELFVIIDVRHEAPSDRVGLEGPTCGLSQQVVEAGGSPTLGAQRRVGAAPTTAGRVGTARRPVPVKQDGKVYERNQ